MVVEPKQSTQCFNGYNITLLFLLPFSCFVYFSVFDVVRPTVDISKLVTSCQFLARDAFVRTNCRAIAMTFVRLSVRPS